MASAPWAAAPAKDTFFALVTGANSGVGLGICQRLIDEFLATRSLTSHLVLIPTTRDTRKSNETTALLRKHLLKTASSPKLQARGATPADTTARVHILSLQLDLCDLTTVHNAAAQLVDGMVPLDGHDGGVRIPRLDTVIFNAGIGGWTGFDWLKLAHNLVTAGIAQALTWPTFKVANAGATVNPLPQQKQADGGNNDKDNAPVVGQLFCANVFGHYLFGHAILPLLGRRQEEGGDDADNIPPGRLIWEGSIEASHEHFRLDDLQAVRTRAAYESTKRLTDLLVLTAELPGARPHSAPYWRLPDQSPPRVYLCHPGIVVTTILPLPFVLHYLWTFAAYVARWVGSPWHTITSYNAAAAMVWLALAAQGTLDAAGAGAVKWGSACDIRGNALVKKTEVDGWGWEGRVGSLDDNDTDIGVLRKTKGRKSGSVAVTEETRAAFEERGALCWREMERLRAEWEARMNEAGSIGHA
ncbi:3-keto-steroid reductase [Diaporthe australafricana]|uniref:3-keto-steroid reductase n=1 Tax=Diaporthe australafricana TaxID=127596 RepID=A0ABR3XIS5_9PEZI